MTGVKTLSSFINNKFSDTYKIFMFMSNVSKNIFNCYVYVDNIYRRYKEEIFTMLQTFLQIEKNQDELLIEQFIQDKLEFFYNLHSKKDSVIKKNNDIIYKSIIDCLSGDRLNNFNFDILKTLVIAKNVDLKYSNDHPYEFKFIVDHILKSMYLHNYNKILFQLHNKIPINNSKEFIEDVKKNICKFPKKESIKKDIEKTYDITSDHNIICKFLRGHMMDNYEKLPSDIIGNIMNKVFDNMKSYYALKQNGRKVNKCKYLKEGELFIVPFFQEMKKSKDDTIELSLGKYIGDHYIEITGKTDLLCLIKNRYDAKYVETKYLENVPQKNKGNKKEYYFVNNNKQRIKKDNVNIIDARHLLFKIPEKIMSKDIGHVEISNKYNGQFFKINIIYYENKKPKKKKKKEKIMQNIELEEEKCISVDLGMRNLMTIYNPTGNQRIIRGGYILSLNKNINDKIDTLKSKISKEKNQEKKKEMIIRKYNIYIKRENKINEHFNNIIKYLHNEYYDKTIIIGWNKGWKDKSNMGNKTNRKFHDIPHRKLIEKMKDKFGKEKIIETEESYTSKCDALSLESIGKTKNYLGNRIKRGLFESSTKQLINADLNGAINIMRKKIYLKEIKGEHIFNPITIKIITPRKLVIRQ